MNIHLQNKLTKKFETCIGLKKITCYMISLISGMKSFVAYLSAVACRPRLLVGACAALDGLPQTGHTATNITRHSARVLDGGGSSRVTVQVLLTCKSIFKHSYIIG